MLSIDAIVVEDIHPRQHQKRTPQLVATGLVKVMDEHEQDRTNSQSSGR
jgi:hypothetical protein